MAEIRASGLPKEALLDRYSGLGAYSDCYTTRVARPVTLTEFVEAFYTTPVFRIERWLIARALGLRSTDAGVKAMARGETGTFAAWKVEAREANQIVLAAGRTCSWLMVSPEGAGSTTLYFGSAVVPGRCGGMGWTFRALLGFHKRYSRVLLSAAVRRLSR